MNVHTHTHTQTRTRTHKHTHTPVTYQGNQDTETEEKVFKKKGFQGRFKRAVRGRTADRSRVLVTDNSKPRLFPQVFYLTTNGTM